SPDAWPQLSSDHSHAPAYQDVDFSCGQGPSKHAVSGGFLARHRPQLNLSHVDGDRVLGFLDHAPAEHADGQQEPDARLFAALTGAIEMRMGTAHVRALRRKAVRSGILRRPDHYSGIHLSMRGSSFMFGA